MIHEIKNITHSHQSHLTQPSQNSWYNEDSEGQLTKKDDRMYQSKLSPTVSLHSPVSNAAFFNDNKVIFFAI